MSGKTLPAAKTANTKPHSQPGLLQRACACGGTPGVDGECAACRAKRLQRAATSQTTPTVAPPLVHEVLGSAGQPLDPGARAFMEPRFGHDFSRVRIHTDAKAAESARAVDARAYTVGRDVVFAAGEYAPSTAKGQRLLAHELTHVVQQGNGNNTLQGSLKVGNTNTTYERQAESLSEQITRTEVPNHPTKSPAATITVMRQASVCLQRAPSELCNAPSHWGMHPLQAAALGLFFQRFIENDYETKMGVSRGVDVYFDTIELLPIDPDYAAFMIRNNPSLSAAKQVFLSVVPLKRPDMLIHKGVLQEFDEIKPDSITGVFDGVMKIYEIAGYMRLLGLPYRFGSAYTPTSRIPIFSITVGGVPVSVSLGVSRKRTGLIVYELCIYTDWALVVKTVIIAAIVAAIIALLRGRLPAPSPSPVPVPALASTETAPEPDTMVPNELNS